ncbi:DUF221-domain-containing protein [Sodiomyces alkalinus F11]|uniref:DUF221-domain-containing protein n=1 Tax=Sodiomyces alkalinus (strain CBS 110278 / VKM F-3762 / F11) TaxID=1314773 RepID=A0A3N2PRL9_SODAK|nr:DUF221-domain-containing protein [Sodiomyces alkalinus F11]ROT37159.1 DUF221-domain-containing protein [Sodiomyces alkalinus F11]
MDVLKDDARDKCGGEEYLKPGSTNITVQLGLSLILGVSAFVAFCILRPRWSTLYAARKRRLDPNIGLPTLPDTFLGWIPGLYRVTEEQVLASAGLDAFVFLSFFKMAIRLFAVMAFFAYAVLWPVNHHYMDWNTKPPSDNTSSTYHPIDTTTYDDSTGGFNPYTTRSGDANDPLTIEFGGQGNNAYLWTWFVFTYFFTALIIYVMNRETFRIIRIRQAYLGTQSTITDRTFRLSGLPSYLKSEEKIKDLIEKLEIGRVECVNLCRDWKELDALMEKRATVLHKLEEAWSVFLGRQAHARLPKPDGRRRNRTADEEGSRGQRHPGGGVEVGIGEGDGDGEYRADGDEDDVERAGENTRLLSHGGNRAGLVDRDRPTITIRYGFLGLRSRKTDAIHYYEEKLRRLDEKIHAARQAKPPATGIAFITMDSIAACQMAIQAHIDPRPGQLLTKPAPSPSDVVWRNTYAPRGVRRLRSWSVTVFVSLLSVVWLGLVASLAGLLTICNLQKWFPDTVKTLEQLPVLKALIETGLPTLLVSLLNVAVPYLYEYLSYQQGKISRGDVELSIISKNFFFSFFNIFFVFAVSSTAINVVQLMDRLQDALRDTAGFARLIANQANKMSVFYISFIMLQGVGLFPFRLLEAGSVFLYPLYRMGAKTPRDFARIMVPPTFSYGFYLPTALLVFILCLVYSVLELGYLVLTVGLAYFVLGYFTYKYQLLYAMDQPQHATGGAWRIICNRVVLGLFVFQVIMASEMALHSAFVQSALTVPLLFLTLWYGHYFGRRFVPLTRFIALRSLRPGAGHVDEDEVVEEGEEADLRPSMGLLRRGSTVDEDKEKGLRFLNPSLTVCPEQPWIYQDAPPTSASDAATQDNLAEVSATALPEQGLPTGGTNSTISLGDTHVWRENGESHV